MISLCVPTRGRPERFLQMLDSARRTAVGPFETVAHIDSDDRSRYPTQPGVTYVRGKAPRDKDGLVMMSGLWTRAWENATGDIAMLAADDIMFETQGWDEQVERAFSRF